MAFSGSSPLISVVMPVFNAAPFLPAAIESILAQSHTHFELIIINDGSTDTSADIIRDYAVRDPRIHPLFMPHGGRAYARNIGVWAARGEFLAWQDADDISLPQRLELQLAWMLRSDTDICGSLTKRFCDADGILWFPQSHAAIRTELFFRVSVLFASTMIRTTVARLYPFDESVAFEDYDWLVKVASHHRLETMPQILYRWRIHPRQSHVRESDSHLRDARACREAHFFRMYPEATSKDFQTLLLVAGNEPFASLEELHLAGEWLVRMAQGDDNYLRQRMLDRWIRACALSAHMGVEVYRLCCDALPSFGLRPGMKERYALKMRCLIRLRHNSLFYRALRSLKRTVYNRCSQRGFP